MYDNILNINKKHKKAAKAILEKIGANEFDKYIITISGEVASGKASIARALGIKLKKRGYKIKTIYLDNYYLIPPEERTEWRKKHGIDMVGPEELDWELVEKNIQDFREGNKSALPLVDLLNDNVDQVISDFKNIQILIVCGLYAVRIENVDLKVFIELTYKETREEQIDSEKEELDEFRMQVLEQEHKAVISLKNKADYFIDFDNIMETFHL
jgi:uridine kinase